MIILSAHQKNLIQRHTLECYPNEMCGVLTETSFISLTNISSNPSKSFSFGSIEYAKVINNTIAIIHSHCRDRKTPEPYDVRTPSLTDIVCQKRSNKPWLIVGTEGEIVTPALQIPREPNAEYLGRPFIWYINDCYNLVEDYYKFTLKIDLPPKDIDFDYTKTRTLFRAFDKYIESYGFRDIKRLEDIRNGDLILVDRQGIEASHLGIYENGYIIHQDSISKKEPISYFKGNIRRILRYEVKDVS